MWSLLTGVLLTMLASAPVRAEDAPPIPPELAPYLTDGAVPDGDYRWLRGRFPGASPAEGQAFVAALKFGEACLARSRAAMQAKMAALGQTWDPGNDITRMPAACNQFTQMPIGAGTDWPTFSAALDRVRPYALGLVRGVELAEQEALGHGDFAQQLRARPTGEQMLRKALIDSQRREGFSKDYSPLERAIHEGILIRALQERDQANTTWLAARVAEKGWPTRSTVGADASGSAWLLVQHADLDPAFQLAALRLMTPLAAKGEVDPTNFAMLTDRVQLRVAGKQKYGTQWTCVAGKWTPRPLEQDAAATDTLRKTVGLDSLQQNAERIATAYGACPKG